MVEIARGIPKEVLQSLHQTDNWSGYRMGVLFPKDLEEYGKARGKIDEVAGGQAAKRGAHDHGNVREFLLLARGALSQKEAVLKNRASTVTEISISWVLSLLAARSRLVIAHYYNHFPPVYPNKN